MQKVPFPVHGPAMEGLDDRQRRFIYEMMQDPFGDHADWARRAGYSDVADGCKVRACMLLQNERMGRAIKEVSGRYMNSVGPMIATMGMMRIASNPKHRDHFKALDSLADRVGFHRQTTHNVAVQHTDLRGEALLERIKTMAALMGVDPAKLLGENVVSREPVETKVIEHQPAEPQPSDDVSAEAKVAFQLMRP